MRRDDEFNSSSYLPPKGDSCEFGSVFAINEHGVRKENASHHSDLNSTKANNDEISSQRSRRSSRNDDLLEDKLRNQVETQTTSSAASSASSAAATGASSSVAAQVASILTATTIIAVGAGAAVGLRTLIHPDASFGDIFVTAHTVHYVANIGEAEEGEFTIRLYSGSFDESQKAIPGVENQGTFENLELGRSYTMEIIQSEEGAETAILSSLNVTTENYSHFESFDFDGTFSRLDNSFDVTLDFVDEKDCYSDFTVELMNPQYPNEPDVYHLEKTTKTQRVEVHRDAKAGGDYIDFFRETLGYRLSYLSSEEGEEERIIVKEGKFFFRDQDLPTLNSFSLADSVSLDGRLPVYFDIDDKMNYMQWAFIRFVKNGDYDDPTFYLHSLKEGCDILDLNEYAEQFDFYSQEVKVQLLASMNNDLVFFPYEREDLDLYDLPYIDFEPGRSEVVLAEKTIKLEKKETNSLVGVQFEGYDITDYTIQASPLFVDDGHHYSEISLNVDCGGRTFIFPFMAEGAGVRLTRETNSGLNPDQAYDLLRNNAATVKLGAKYDGGEMVYSKPQTVHFARSTKPSLDSYDFFGFTTDGDNIFVAVDVYDPLGSVGDVRIDITPIEGDYRDTMSVTITNPTSKIKQVLPLPAVYFDLLSTHVRVDLYLNTYNSIEYQYVLTETIDNVLFKMAPAVTSVYFEYYAPVVDPLFRGQLFVKEPDHSSKGIDYLSNIEIELKDDYGHAATAKCQYNDSTENIIGYKFALDVIEAGITLNRMVSISMSMPIMPSMEETSPISSKGRIGSGTL